MSAEFDDTRDLAVCCYMDNQDRLFVPGDVVEIPIDALVFAEYQQPWLTLADFKKDRCVYDAETNDWLLHQVTQTLLQPEIPPIYVDVLSEGVALVDGAHRVTAALIAGHHTIRAQLNASCFED